MKKKTGHRISPAKIDVISEIDRIEREAFHTPWSADLIRAAILNSQYEVRIIRIFREPVLGFYIAHNNNELSNLDNLAVDIHARGEGLGRKLLIDWMDRARYRNKSGLSLQVNIQNQRAQKLYQEFEFNITKRLSNYYPNGDHAYQMEMEFTNSNQRMFG